MTLRERFNNFCARPFKRLAQRTHSRELRIMFASIYGIVDTFGPIPAAIIIVKPIFDSYTERLRQAVKERNKENAKRGKSTVPGV